MSDAGRLEEPETVKKFFTAFYGKGKAGLNCLVTVPSVKEVLLEASKVL